MLNFSSSMYYIASKLSSILSSFNKKYLKSQFYSGGSLSILRVSPLRALDQYHYFLFNFSNNTMENVFRRLFRRYRTTMPDEIFVGKGLMSSSIVRGVAVEQDGQKLQMMLNPIEWRKALVTHENAKIQITDELLQCLRPRGLLNDQVINVYLELLKEREKRDPQTLLKCHFFNTFFYKKIFVPIHEELHWCLAVINKTDQKFQYLDLLRGYDTEVMQLLAKYYVDEVKEKSGKDIDVSSWKFECVEDLPEQENGLIVACS